jgi:hypothetical protein
MPDEPTNGNTAIEHVDKYAGRDPVTGRLLPGHKVARGNPRAIHIQKLRSAVAEATTAEQITEAMTHLRKIGMEGDVQALRLWLEYTLGKPDQAVKVEIDDTSHVFEVVYVRRGITNGDDD